MSGAAPEIPMLGGAALAAFAVAPALWRRCARFARLAFARALGRMRPFTGRAHVVDGDTVVVNSVRVRLFGMDAPEMTQAGGAAARFRLKVLIGGGEVHVTPLDKDKFGRTVARVRRDGLDLSRAMVRDGFARAAPHWTWANLGTEFAARVRRRGLWAEDPFNGISDPAMHRRTARRVRR